MPGESELLGLIEAIRERPDEDLPRLALADWCMEQPDPLAQARGEFIQLRCQAARLDPADPARPPLEHRARQSRERHERQWLGALAGAVDGWDFERGLVVVELRPGFHRRLSLKRLGSQPEWFWVIGAKGVLLGAEDVRQLLRSPLSAQLTLLDLGDCEVGRAGAWTIAGCESLARLTCLRLPYARVGDEGAEALAKSPHLGRLAELSLSACAIGTAGVQALAGAAALARLASLDLSANPLGLGGARALAACSALRGLTALRLTDCQLTDRGAWALVQSAALQKVEFLDVRDNGLGEDASEALRERFGSRVRV